MNLPSRNCFLKRSAAAASSPAGSALGRRPTLLLPRLSRKSLPRDSQGCKKNRLDDRHVGSGPRLGLVLILFCCCRQKSILPPPTITKVWFSSYNYKTGYFTSLNFSNRAFYLPRAVLKTVCYRNRSFVFFFF